MGKRVSGYATQLCHEEMGSSGNYIVWGCFEPGSVPADDDMHAEVTLAPVAAVPDVDPEMLDLRRFTKHLNNAELAENDPFRWAGVAIFLSSRTTSLHCPGLDAPVDIPVNEQRRAKQVYGKLWGKSRTVSSLICVDFGHVHERRLKSWTPFWAPADAMQNLPSAPVHANREATK
eukprot:jgi/Tetstr1/442908/TSEL_030971.t1